MSNPDPHLSCLRITKVLDILAGQNHGKEIAPKYQIIKTSFRAGRKKPEEQLLVASRQLKELHSHIRIHLSCLVFVTAYW